jgi:predicted Rossmann fold flavoprotein
LKEKIIVVGGGAAGFFAAINIAQKNKNAEVTILERSDKLLYKVEISGGGRCNVTHQCFEPKALTKNYPRGEKELLSVFTRFQPKDTIEWFDKRGVQLKAEPDGRMFPVSNTSSTIINCFLSEAKKSAVKIEFFNLFLMIV